MLELQLQKKQQCLLNTILYANAATIASNDKLFHAAYFSLPLVYTKQDEQGQQGSNFQPN